MRTTITLEPDVGAQLEAFADRRRLTFEDAVNALLRRGLSAQVPGARRKRRFAVTPNRSGFRAGVDPGRLNQLLDQLDVEAFSPPEE